MQALRELGDDETLLVQSGKPVGVFRTHVDAPRVLIANSNLVGRWSTWDHFHELDRKGLMMYGQMTAGSWIYIGSQGIVQGTYETFVEMGRQHYGGNLAGKWILTAGLGGMGGAQPLAATMAGASMLAIECRPERIRKRLETRYLDVARRHARRGARAASSGRGDDGKADCRSACSATPPRCCRELLRRGVRPDAVTDQTSAHDPVNGYLPEGWTVEQWEHAQRSARRRSGGTPVDGEARARDARVPQARHSGLRLRQQHPAGRVRRGRAERVRISRASCRRTCDRCSVAASDRSAGSALSGDPEDIHRTDAKVKELIPDDAHLHRWLDMARERIQFQGLPARICWVGLGQRHQLGLAFNEMVARGELKAPIVIGRDHLDSGSVASPNRETEAMRDGSDAVADWPLLNALLNTASGATWVSIHHGGGVGIGYSQHAGVVDRLRRHARLRRGASSACCGTIRRPA